MLMYLYVRCVCVIYIKELESAPSDLMNSSKTHQHVFYRHAIGCYQDACHLLCVSSMCTSKKKNTEYGR